MFQLLSEATHFDGQQEAEVRNPFRKRNLSELKLSLSRTELIRRSRVLIIDDEKPEIIEDLTRAGFAVDYMDDVKTETMEKIDRPLYDLILLDFKDVGGDFGPDEGLDLMRHIKRVCPAVVILTYTSKALETRHAEFYRLADGTLSKDAGIGESTEKIESGLQKAHSLDNVWRGLLATCNVAPGSREDLEWQDLLVRGMNRQGNRDELKRRVLNALDSDAAQPYAILLFGKLIELAIKATIGV